jgi:hypothetical protein
VDAKTIEIRDKGTFIPAIAVSVSGTDGYLMRRAGFNHRMVYLIHANSERCAYDPFTWADRTMQTAHLFIEKEWDSIRDGQVVDVQFVLGETPSPKVSESVNG